MDQNQNSSLFEAFRLGDITVQNRMVMAPMTRSRADHATHTPTDIMSTYYGQRAGAGLIISEGVIINETGNGYINIPGIYSEAQVAAWRKVTDAVHAQGGKIFAQLWHVGRMSHPDLIGGRLPLAPSAINPNYYAFTFEGRKETVTPQAMSLQDISDTISDFRKAALNAMEAGFDGVEIHGANTYLIHQFLATSANQRTDAYGGSVENRARLLFEVLEAVTEAVGSGRVGIRLSPEDTNFAGIVLDAETTATFDYAINRLNDYPIAYLHLTAALMQPAEGKAPYQLILDSTERYKDIYHGNIIINKGFDKQTAEQVVSKGIADLVAFGSPFIANPDLVERFKHNLPLNTPDADTFYQGGEQGYIDYPVAQRQIQA